MTVALGPRQPGQPPVDQLDNGVGARFPGQRRLDLPPEPRIALGLVQHQLRKLVGAEFSQFVSG